MADDLVVPDNGNRLRATMLSVSGINPDEHARALALQRQHGIGRQAAGAAASLAPASSGRAPETDYRKLAVESPLLGRWLANHDNAAIGQDDIAALQKIAGQAGKLSDSHSYLNDLIDADASGRARLKGTAYINAGAFALMPAKDAAAAYVGSRRAMQLEQPQYAKDAEASNALGRQGVDEAFGAIKSGVSGLLSGTSDDLAGDALKALGGALALPGAAVNQGLRFVGSPRTAIRAGAEGLEPSLPMMAGGLIGSGLAPWTAGVSVPVMAALGAGVGAGFTASGSGIEKALADAGVNLDDEASVERAFSDPKLMAYVRNQAGQAGVTSTVLNGALMLGAGQYAGAAAAAGTSRVVGAAKDVGAVTAGMVPVAMTEHPGTTVGHAAESALASLPMTAGMEAIATANHVDMRPEAIMRSLIALEDGKAVQGTADARGESKAAGRAPDRVGGLVESSAGRAAGVTRVSRETFDRVYLAQGRSPLEAAAEITADGTKRYYDAAQTGELEIPTRDFLRLAQTDAPAFDALKPEARFREGAPTETEATAHVEEVRAEVERATKEAQAGSEEVRALAEKAAGLDAEIADLTAKAPSETTQAQSEAARAQSSPNATRLFQSPAEPFSADAIRHAADVVERTGEGLASVGVNDPAAMQQAIVNELAPALDKIDPGTVDAAAIADVIRKATEDPAGFAAELRARADAMDSAAKLADLKKQRAEVQAQIDARLARDRANMEASDRILADTQAALVAAGHSARSAGINASLAARLFRVAAERYGATTEALAQEFPVDVVSAPAPASNPDARASYVPALDGVTARIELHAGQDASSFAHEIGHHFLRMMDSLALRADAPHALAADVASIRDYLGANPGEPLTPAQEERFAETWEQYLADGKAPTPEVRSIFRTFARWLARIYPDLKRLGVKFSDDVRSILDRIVATDAEIDRARTDIGPEIQLTPAEQGSFSPDELAAYEASKQNRDDVAREKVRREAFRDLAADRRELREKELDRYRIDAQAQVKELPAVRALEELRGKISRESAREAAKEKAIKPETVTKLDRAGALGAEGADVRAAAEQFGFPDADTMGDGLLLASKPERLVEQLARARLAAEHPDLVGTPELRRIARKAETSVDANEVANREAHMLRRLAAAKTEKAAGKAAAGVAADAERAGVSARKQAFDDRAHLAEIRKQATQILAAQPLNRIRPSAYLASARRQAETMADLHRAGDYANAAIAADRHTLNLELHRIATGIKDQAAKDVRYALKIQSPHSQETLTRAGPTYAERANAILAQYDFTKQSGPAIDRASRTREWIDYVEQETGRRPDIPEAVIDSAQRQHYSTLTPSELSDVRDALEAIYHNAQTKDELMRAGAERAYSKTRDEIVSTLAAFKPLRADANRYTTLSDPERSALNVTSYIDSHFNVAQFMREIDGGANGVLWNALQRPINDAVNAERLREGIETERWNAVQELLPGIHDRSFSTPVDVPGYPIKISQEDKLGILSYWGTESGQQRITGGLRHDIGPVTAADVQALIDSVTPAELAYLNAKWAFWDAFHPEIKTQQQRIDGTTPTFLEPVPFETPAGQATGGYRRLKYQSDASMAALTTTEQAVASRRARGVRGQTVHGYTETRRANVQDMPRLDLRVEEEHLREVVHDLAFRGVVIDNARLLQDPAVAAAFKGHAGPLVLRQFKTWHNDVAAGRTGGNDVLGGLAKRLKSGTQTEVMAMNLTQSALNIAGITQAWRRLGIAGTTDAFMQWTGSLPGQEFSTEWIAANDPFMRTRPETFNRDLMAVRDKLGRSDTENLYHDAIFYAFQKTQAVADNVTWIAGYKRARADGMTHEDAVAVAGQDVRDLMGSGNIADLPAILRGGDWQKLLTIFKTWTIRTLGQNREMLTEFRRGDHDPAAVLKLATDAMLVNAIPAALTYGFGLAFRGKKGNTDGEDVARGIGAETVKSLIGPWFLIGDVGNAVASLIEKRAPTFIDYSPAGLNAPATAVDLAKELAAHGISLRAAEEANTLLGIAKGYPAAFINRVAEAVSQTASGKIHGPRVVTAPIFGPPRK